MAELYERGGLRVEGITQTVKALQALGEPLEGIKAVLKSSAEILAQQAKTTVPVRSGKLARTIRPYSTTRAAFVIAGSKKVPYANPIHWGWFRDRKSEQARKSGKGYINKNIKPNPFMAKALGYTKEEIMDNYINLMEHELVRLTNLYGGTTGGRKGN
jgi:hypothetical protein